MDPCYLNKPELAYELDLRSVSFEPTNTADELRLLLGSHIDALLLDVSPYPIDRDLKELQKCISVISGRLNIPIVNMQHKNKISAYLYHITHRLDRVDISTELPIEHLDTYNSLVSQTANLQAKFDTIYQTSTYHTAFSTLPQSPDPNSMALDILTDKLSNIVDNRVSGLKKFCFKVDSCPIDFIKKVEEFAHSHDINDRRLYQHIYDFLSGTPLDWYRSKKDSLSDWSSFKTQFISDFEIHDYDYKQHKIIDSRKQKPNERVVIYFAAMETLFSKLREPLSESAKLIILRRNLSPIYSSRLLPADLTSIDQLVKACKWYESCTSVDNSNILEPNISIQNTPQPSTSQSLAISTPVKRETPFRAYFACPRCRTNSHTLQCCTSTKVVCYRCGKPDVTFNNCPTCQKTGPKN